MHLTRKGIKWDFSDATRKAFQYLKTAFTTAPILMHWIPDKPIIVETDASNYALGAILSIQLDSEMDRIFLIRSATALLKKKQV